MMTCPRCHRTIADSLILPDSGMCTSCTSAPPGPIGWEVGPDGTSEESRKLAAWHAEHPETWKQAMIRVGRWPGQWVYEPRPNPITDAAALADRATEAVKRGALNLDASPCVDWWCAGGFDHPLGVPFYEVPGDPRHNCYCLACAKRIELEEPVGL